MCYSARIKTRLKELAAEFGAEIDLESFGEFFSQRIARPELKIPLGLDLYFLLSQDPAENRFAPEIRRFHAEEKDRLRAKLEEAERELAELRSGKPTAANKKKAEVRERRILQLGEKIAAPLERLDPLSDRIFPMSFAPVILSEGKGLRLRPMRYRVLPASGQEIPASYNVFNARRDSLLSAQTWKPLFGRQHALFPFQSFYEWVEGPAGKPHELLFHPEGKELMWAASLFSVSQGLYSFAMVTDEPPPEVAAAGHDRCPLFLERSAIAEWLHPEPAKRNELLALLGRKEPVFYRNQPAA